MKTKKLFKISSNCKIAIGFTSCEKCKDCTPQINWTWDDGLSSQELEDMNATYVALGYEDADDYYNSLYQWETTEYCDEDLKDAEDFNESVAFIHLATIVKIILKIIC